MVSPSATCYSSLMKTAQQKSHIGLSFIQAPGRHFGGFAWTGGDGVISNITTNKKKERPFRPPSSIFKLETLQQLHVLCLPALGPLDYVELHSLAFL